MAGRTYSSTLWDGTSKRLTWSLGDSLLASEVWVVEADPRSMLVLVAYSSSQLNFSSNTLPLSFANASRLMGEQTDQTDALVAESIHTIRPPCFHAFTTSTAKYRRLLQQAVVAFTAHAIIPWLIRHPKVVHAIDMLEGLSLLPWKPLRPPTWPGHKLHAMTYLRC
jgi:hypothetical protein